MGHRICALLFTFMFVCGTEAPELRARSAGETQFGVRVEVLGDVQPPCSIPLNPEVNRAQAGVKAEDAEDRPERLDSIQIRVTIGDGDDGVRADVGVGSKVSCPSPSALCHDCDDIEGTTWTVPPGLSCQRGLESGVVADLSLRYDPVPGEAFENADVRNRAGPFGVRFDGVRGR